MIEHYCVIRGHKLNKLEANEIYKEALKIFSDELNNLTTYGQIVRKYGFVGMNKEIYSDDSKDLIKILTLSKKFNLSLVMIYFKPEILDDKKCAVNIPFYLPNIHMLSNGFDYAFYVHNGMLEIIDKEKAYELYDEYMKDYKCEALFSENDYSCYIGNEIRNKKRGSRIEEWLKKRNVSFDKHIKGVYDYYKEGIKRLDKASRGEKSGWYFIDNKLDVYNEYINAEREVEIHRSKYSSEMKDVDDWDDLYRELDLKKEKIRKKLDGEDEDSYWRYHEYIRFLNIIKVSEHYDLDNEYLILSKIDEAGNQFLKNIQKALIDRNYEFKDIRYDEYIKSIEELLNELNKHRRIIGCNYHYIEYDD